MLAFAAQGVSSGDGKQSGGRIREVLQQAVDALSGLADACTTAVRAEPLEPAETYLAFFAVIDRDARDALAAIRAGPGSTRHQDANPHGPGSWQQFGAHQPCDPAGR